MASLAERVRWILKARGLSERELAKLSGRSKSYIQTITSGTTKNPTRETLDLIARAAGVRFDWLARGIEPREPYETSEPLRTETSLDRAVVAARVLGIPERAIQHVVERRDPNTTDPGALYWYHQIEAEMCRLAKPSK